MKGVWSSDLRNNARNSFELQCSRRLSSAGQKEVKAMAREFYKPYGKCSCSVPRIGGQIEGLDISSFIKSNLITLHLVALKTRPGTECSRLRPKGF